MMDPRSGPTGYGVFDQFAAGTSGPGGAAPARRRPRAGDEDFVPARRYRGQRPVDAASGIIRYLTTRPYSNGRSPFAYHVPPHEYYCKDTLPPFATAFNPSTAFCTQWAHTCQFPAGPRGERGVGRMAFTSVCWAPTGRRLLCGTSQGDFVVYNGAAFTADMRVLHGPNDGAVRAMDWGATTGMVVTGDDKGNLTLWGPNFSMAAKLNYRGSALRDASWAPGENRFCTGGQDGTVAVWDPVRVASSAGGADAAPESRLQGHGGDVKSVQWHPSRALIASSSYDKDIRLWDPRLPQHGGSASSVAVMQGHADIVSSVRWHALGRDMQLLSSCLDGAIRLWDLRVLRPIAAYRGHAAAVNSIQWHPTHPDLFVSAGDDGVIGYWAIGADAQASMGANAVGLGGSGVVGSAGAGPHGAAAGSSSFPEIGKFSAAVQDAHDRFRDQPNKIGCLAWSPTGHVLASAAAEVHIWTRNKPGAIEEARFEGTGAGNVDEGATAPVVAGGAMGLW